MSAISDLFLAGMDEVRRSWGWFFAGGTLLILLGVMCVVKAETATTFSVLVLGWILMFIEIIRSLSLSILLYSNDSIVMPVVIYDLYETGAYPALSAFSVLQTILVFTAIYGAKKIARLDSFMQLK